MKANELMIGDWVYYGNRQVQVLQLSEGKDYKTTRPIPLTPEVLEKNGFVFVEGWWEIPRLPQGHGYIAIAFDSDGKGRQTNTIYDLDVSRKESGGADLHLNYVHELQHALRLCGIEKEIIL